MSSTNRAGTVSNEVKLKDLVSAAIAKADAIKGMTVLKICHMAIRSSLAICDLSSKSTLRTGLVLGELVAELIN